MEFKSCRPKVGLITGLSSTHRVDTSGKVHRVHQANAPQGRHTCESAKACTQLATIDRASEGARLCRRARGCESICQHLARAIAVDTNPQRGVRLGYTAIAALLPAMGKVADDSQRDRHLRMERSSEKCCMHGVSEFVKSLMDSVVWCALYAKLARDPEQRHGVENSVYIVRTEHDDTTKGWANLKQQRQVHGEMHALVPKTRVCSRKLLTFQWWTILIIFMTTITPPLCAYHTRAHPGDGRCCVSRDQQLCIALAELCSCL